MKVPEQWLRSYCDPEMSSEELEHRLTMAGLEVEERRPVAPPFSKVVVARIVSAERHPDADRLQVCQVDTGVDTRSIVCGAPNARAGLWTACALPGAELPGGMKIGVTKMRGVESQGMLCSARELGLGDEHGGIMELAEPEEGAGVELRRALALDESVMELKLTPNLAHCMSVTGVAQELSAISGAPFRWPGRSPERSPQYQPVSATLKDTLPVRIDAPELCGRFSGRIVRGVDPKARTPEWMRRRLERAGQRSISALVDISNYVMLELGRPSHIFDLDKIRGGLVVRWGRAGEKLELLNGQTIDVGPREGLKVGVIADDLAVESLAGIMGGEASSVTDQTRNIYVEIAFWWASAIAGRPRLYNFSTDAAQRFERGVDASTTVEHLEYVTALILRICGGEAGPVTDDIKGMPERKPVSLRLARLRKVAGVDIPKEEVLASLDRLGLSPVMEGDASGDGERMGERVRVTPPPRRFDLQIEEDLIEEVLRIRGYDRIETRAARHRATMMPVPEGRISSVALKRRWAARGYQELVNFSFVAREDDRRFGDGTEAIDLLNPIAENLDVMRTGLWSGLLGALVRNANRKIDRARLFELGRVYWPAPGQQAGALQLEGIAQPWRLGLLAWGPAHPEQWGLPTRSVDFFDLKGDLESAHPEVQMQFEAAEHPSLHPGQCARILVEGQPIGWIGALHPRLLESLDLNGSVYLAELDAEVLQRRALPAPRSPSRFPPAVRDLALVVADSVAAGEMRDALLDFCRQNAVTKAVQTVSLFDEYRGKGLENKEKSLAFRFFLQDTERTLGDAEVDAAMAAVVEHAGQRFAARLR